MKWDSKKETMMQAGGPEKSSNKHGKAPGVKNLPVNAGDASNES